MMQTNYHYQSGMAGHVNAVLGVPPYRVNGLLPSSTALTSLPIPMLEPAVEYVLTLRDCHVQLMTSSHLSRLCMRLSLWLYKMAGY